MFPISFILFLYRVGAWFLPSWEWGELSDLLLRNGNTVDIIGTYRVSYRKALWDPLSSLKMRALEEVACYVRRTHRQPWPSEEWDCSLQLVRSWGLVNCFGVNHLGIRSAGPSQTFRVTEASADILRTLSWKTPGQTLQLSQPGIPEPLEIHWVIIVCVLSTAQALDYLLCGKS